MTLRTAFHEADWEGLALERLGDQGWKPLHGDDVAPGTGERGRGNGLPASDLAGSDALCF